MSNDQVQIFGDKVLHFIKGRLNCDALTHSSYRQHSYNIIGVTDCSPSPEDNRSGNSCKQDSDVC